MNIYIHKYMYLYVSIFIYRENIDNIKNIAYIFIPYYRHEQLYTPIQRSSHNPLPRHLLTQYSTKSIHLPDLPYALLVMDTR